MIIIVGALFLPLVLVRASLDVHQFGNAARAGVFSFGARGGAGFLNIGNIHGRGTGFVAFAPTRARNRLPSALYYIVIR